MDTEFVALELLVQCSSCGVVAPVTRPEQRTLCSNCLHETDVDDEAWTKAIDGAQATVAQLGLGAMEGGRLDRPGRDVEWRRGPGRPKCEQCSAGMRPSPDGKRAVCPACNAQRPIERPPPFLRAKSANILGVVADAAPAAGAAKTKELAIPCAKCGATLSSDGGSRTLDCNYCHVTNVLPEDVWHALHPPKLRRPFSILFELTPDPRRITPNAGSEMRTNVIVIFIALAIFANIPAGITMSIVSDDKTPATAYLLYLGLWVGIPFVIAFIGCLRTWLFMRTVLKADQELVARLTDWEKEWSNVLLFKGGDPTVAVGEGRVKLSEKDFQNLGGVGGHVRAWTNRDGTKREIRAMPSGLV